MPHWRPNPRRISQAERIEQTADSLRRNIYDTIREHGGDPRYLEGYRAAGWESPEAAADAHQDSGFERWMELVPEQLRRDRLVAFDRFLAEWPRIREAI